ncbi:uncharacterized protein PRCAT00000079001 [Priceomyces carsonii]|uniref:uncharacterized protein n=1 Tax=Priceomyces carsonii TaxID=28549 RepID=UPI002EDAA5CC|nr:unnamed protein product [Priceomyces carsonii]
MAYEDKLVAPALKLRNFLDKIPNIHNVYFIAAISCISGMMFGFDITSMSAFLDTEQYLDFFDSPSSAMQGFITASMSFGSFWGSLASTFVSEPFGRRASLLLCACFWMIGAAIQSSVQNRAQLIIGRMISGFGVGFGSSVAPVYGSELAPRKIRGMIGGFFQFSVTLGILIMFFISYGLQFMRNTASFRIAWAIQIVPGLFLFLGCFIIPESPRWLAKQGYWEEAETIVANIQAKGNREDPDVLIEISEIKEQILVDENIKAFTYADLFKKKYIKRTFTAVSAQIWQQLTGMNVMMYYITLIFKMAGYSGDSNLLASAIQYILNTVTTIPALYLMDKVGRRPVLLTGAAMMMAWQFAVAGLLSTYAEVDSDGSILIPKSDKPAAKGVIACCYLFVVSFASSWGVCIWLYCAEIWGDNASRQRGAALATAANWIFNFAIAMFTPSSFANISWKTYCIYATFCGCMFIHTYFGFLETKGKRLEEIDQMWVEGVLPWKSGSWTPRVPLLSDAELGDKLRVEHREGGDDEKLIESAPSHSTEEK